MNTYSYKNFAYYGKNHSKDYLSKKLDKYAPCDLAHMLVSNKIWDGTIKTEHELSCATEELDEWLSTQRSTTMNQHQGLMMSMPLWLAMLLMP